MPYSRDLVTDPFPLGASVTSDTTKTLLQVKIVLVLATRPSRLLLRLQRVVLADPLPPCASMAPNPTETLLELNQVLVFATDDGGLCRNRVLADPLPLRTPVASDATEALLELDFAGQVTAFFSRVEVQVW